MESPGTRGQHQSYGACHSNHASWVVVTMTDSWPPVLAEGTGVSGCSCGSVLRHASTPVQCLAGRGVQVGGLRVQDGELVRPMRQGRGQCSRPSDLVGFAAVADVAAIETV